MKRARALHQLQTVEADIDLKSRRLKEVETQLRNNDVVQAARSVVEKAEGRLKKAQAEARRLDLENQGLEGEIKAVEGQLYSGRITNPKELANLEDKLGHLKGQLSKLEDDLLENMLESEEAETALAESRENLARVETEWQAGQSDLTQERDTLGQKLTALRAEQDTLRETISAEDLDVFEDLRRRKGGRAVVKLADGVCRGCGVSVPMSKAEAAHGTDELVFCGSCERILDGQR